MALSFDNPPFVGIFLGGVLISFSPLSLLDPQRQDLEMNWEMNASARCIGYSEAV